VVIVSNRPQWELPLGLAITIVAAASLWARNEALSITAFVLLTGVLLARHLRPKVLSTTATTLHVRGLWSSKFFDRNEVARIEVRKVWRVPVMLEDVAERYVVRLCDGTSAFSLSSSDSAMQVQRLERQASDLSQALGVPLVRI
jgi:hypothetical protein